MILSKSYKQCVIHHAQSNGEYVLGTHIIAIKLDIMHYSNTYILTTKTLGV